MDGSIFFHIDVNSAFLSWSALKLLQEGYGTDIRGIPAVIGGDQATRHGIVVAKSLPAKACGIRTAETVASALQKCPNLLVIPPDHAYYRERSRALMEHLSGVCPVIEQVSIDECYMLFDPIRGRFASPEEAARRLKDGVREKFGFTVNVGVSDRKVLAKMASDLEKPDKVHTLYAREIEEKMWPMPVRDLFMCGRSAADKLNKMGIRTIGDLARCDPALVETWLKSHGRMLWKFANGIDPSTVHTSREPAKGIGNSTTIARDVTDPAEAHGILKKLAASVSRRLKKGGFLAGQLCVEIRYADFVNRSHQGPLPSPTADAEKLHRFACALFDTWWTKDPVRLLGIRASRLSGAQEPQQINLFDFQKQQEEDERQKKVDTALKDIRRKYGDGAITKGLSEKEREDIDPDLL